jgi:hypothetical protein
LNLSSEKFTEVVGPLGVSEGIAVGSVAVAVIALDSGFKLSLAASLTSLFESQLTKMLDETNNIMKKLFLFMFIFF